MDGWGWCTDIPNPCKLSGLMESVQLQAEIFVSERERGLGLGLEGERRVCGRESGCGAEVGA